MQTVMVEPFTFELYRDVWDSHKYLPMSNRDFCLICSHSRWFHIENKGDLDANGN